MKNSALLQNAFKLRFGLKLCLLTIAGGLAVTLFLYFVTAQSLGTSYGKAIYGIYDLKIRIFPLIFSSFYSIFILAVVTAAIAAITLLFSHKIAGPLFRIEKNLEVIGSGDLTVNTRFRGSDQLISLADDINSMVRSLNHTARSCGDALLKVQDCEERVGRLLEEPGAAKGELEDAVLALKLSIEEVKRLTSSIKVKD